MLSQVIFYKFVTLKRKLSTKTKTTLRFREFGCGSFPILPYASKKRKKSHLLKYIIDDPRNSHNGKPYTKQAWENFFAPS